MPLPLVLLIYNLLLPVALLVLLPASVWKMRKRGGYGSRFWQRFGWFDAATSERLAAAAGKCRWMHAVSVGEVMVARKLVAELLRRNPGEQVVLSVTTSTGFAVACEGAPSGLEVIYSPVDLPWVVKAVCRRIRPRQFVLVEAEVWPNLVHEMRRNAVPVLLVNARLSHRSETRYQRFHRWAAPVFGMLDKVLVQEPEDVARWQSVGVQPGAVEVSGSIKFDQETTGESPHQEEQLERFRRMVRQVFELSSPRLILVASSHPGEEEAIAGIWAKIRSRFPDHRLVVVPRHVERRVEVMAAIRKTGLAAALRSQQPQPGSPKPVPPTTPGLAPDVLIVDSTGELRDWQVLAELVIIGKSFLARGGQNPVEAIAAGVPVLTGPHMENFSALMTLLHAADGIATVPSMEQLGDALVRMISDPEAAREMALRGRQALERHGGSTRRTVEVLLRLSPGL